MPSQLTLSPPARLDLTALSCLRARGGGGIPPPSPGYDCGVRGWIPPPTFPLRERGGISPSTFLYPSAGESHRHLSFERTRLGPTANFPLGAGGRMSPPSSFYAGIPPPHLVCPSAAGSRRHLLICTCAVRSRRRPSFTRARLDLAAVPLFTRARLNPTAIPSFMHARVDPTAVPHVCAVGSDYRLSSFTCARASHRQLPSSHGRSDLAAITLVYARADGSHRHSLVYSCAGGYHCHLFIFACAGGSHRRPSLTCAQRDLTADSPLRACGGISPQTLVNIYPVGAVVELDTRRYRQKNGGKKFLYY
ncbi:hypothetical protein C8F04DRAFT_1403963 [Mycena alexandri]|uniref:Uncharacterized protein n=1 Tax=Mycena alexandri TaxID=1745969 RepID=A0AAD6S3S1_9AGAR|nr:hypothetical protein C8F04DRAFT_1403963 [Mycena alexandri]